LEQKRRRRHLIHRQKSKLIEALTMIYVDDEIDQDRFFYFIDKIVNHMLKQGIDPLTASSAVIKDNIVQIDESEEGWR
jgi:hypothetical protein